MKALFTISLTLLLLASCESVVQYELPELQQMIVVESIVSTDSTWQVRINYSQAPNSSSEPNPVNDAEILISVLDEAGNTDDAIQKFNFIAEGNGLYTYPTNPFQGRVYKMDIEVGDEKLHAKTFIPKIFEPKVIQKTVNAEEGLLEFEVDLGSEQSEGVYYAYQIEHIKPSVSIDQGGEDPDPKAVPDETTEENNLNNNSPSLLRNKGINTAIPVFADQNTFSASFSTTDETIASTNGSPDTENVNTECITPNFNLQIWAISSEYYNYLVSVQNNDFVPSSDFIASNNYSNVINGGGIFAGYNLKVIPL